MKINTTDPLKAHSHLGALGWLLQSMPAQHPQRAIGCYSRQDITAFLLRRGEHLELQEQPTSLLDARLPQYPFRGLPDPDQDTLRRLWAERNTCTDERVTAIDREMMPILLKYWA